MGGFGQRGGGPASRLFKVVRAAHAVTGPMAGHRTRQQGGGFQAAMANFSFMARAATASSGL